MVLISATAKQMEASGGDLPPLLRRLPLVAATQFFNVSVKHSAPGSPEHSDCFAAFFTSLTNSSSKDY